MVQIAALLHDIGKPVSRKINPRNNHVQFFVHESLSAVMAEDILNLMIEENMITDKEKIVVIKFIVHHAFLSISNKKMDVKCGIMKNSGC